MSLRHPSKIKWASIAPILLIVLCLGGAASAVADNAVQQPSVQNYADQAVPSDVQQQYYNSPLSAGTLTLQDVLEAHQPPAAPTLPPAIKPVPSASATAPLLTPPAQSSSTSLMMSQGMKAVLQKVGDTAMPPPATPAGATVAAAQAQGTPVPLVPAAGASDAAVPVSTADGLKYEPGQAPKNLGAVPGAAGSAATPARDVGASPLDSAGTAVPVGAATDASASAAAPVTGQGCNPAPQKWEKSCGDVGYPTNYIGKIVGETRANCADGSLHDFWVTNSCAPPDASYNSATTATDAVCGVASNNEYDDAPVTSLCAQGIASAVSGDGPWTWACSGVNGGQAAACSARKRQPAANGACGTANGAPSNVAPSGDLCVSGFPTSVKGNGPWTWSCHGVGGGSTASCIAPVGAAPHAAAAAAPVMMDEPAEAAPVAAAQESAPSEKGEFCGAAAETLAYESPDKDLCRVGAASVVNGDGPWSWSCTDNDGRTSSCRTLSLSGGDAAPAPAATPAAEPATPSAAPQAAVMAAPAASGSPRLPGSSPFGTGPSVPAPSSTASAAVAAAPAEAQCGLASSQPTLQAPVTELCAVGKPSSLRGSGPWRWSCTKGHSKTSCETPKVVDGSCGPANGAALKSVPFAGLCASGTPTGIEGDGPWNWNCNGAGGGVNVSCAASVQGKIDGICGPVANAKLVDAPTQGLCASGAASAVSGTGPWTWSCSGSNGGDVSTCSASVASAPKAPGPKVDGLCGAANGVTTPTQPTDGLCSGGSATAVVGNGPWNWNCVGENAGMSVSCTAPLEPPAPLDGGCGPASGVPTITLPQSGLCASGLTGRVNGKGPWTWTCSGVNGGNAASCVAPVAGRTGSMPSSMTTASGDTADNGDQSAVTSGLVTPRLPTSSTDALPPLDKKVIPRLTPSAVPPSTVLAAVPTPASAPDLGEGSTPVMPPAPQAAAITPAPSLQDLSPEERSAAIPGNHLTLDPTISTIIFDRGSGNIDENVLPNLDRLAAVLLAHYDIRITLTAYADNEGSTPRDARRLSLTRALAIRDYLGSKGIADSRIDVRAEGANTTSGYTDRVDVSVNN